MARTVGDVVDRALQHLSIIVSGESASAADSALCLDAFNAMVDGWFGSGLSPVADETADEPVALVEGTEYEAADALPVLARHYEGLAAMLAVLVADSFEAQLKPAVVAAALAGRQKIDAAFGPSMVASVDRALKRMPSSRYWPSS